MTNQYTLIFHAYKLKEEVENNIKEILSRSTISVKKTAVANIFSTFSIKDFRTKEYIKMKLGAAYFVALTILTVFLVS